MQAAEDLLVEKVLLYSSPLPGAKVLRLAQGRDLLFPFAEH